jgi:HD-like signal output (HDOD) protein
VSSLSLWIAAALAFAVASWWFLRPAGRTPTTAQTTRPPKLGTQRSAATTASPAQAPAAAPPEQPLPPELANFRWRAETELDAEHRATMIAAVRGIPRPPRSMQQLLSPEFVATAGSAELSDLVMGEPLIAARVISTVNAPFYGLHRPVTNIGQAVTFLGMNSVRGICLQYMLAEAFKPTLANTQKAFDVIWKASAIASELAVRLGKALNLPEQGSLSTQVVLSFVGQLATASLIPPSELGRWLASGRLERARLEQDLLGLNACEIGALLMKTWELPTSLVGEVSAMGRQLVTPYLATDPARAPRLALGYLCARLGERLALGQMRGLEGYELRQDQGADTHHLRASLSHPALARLEQALASPDVQAAVLQMLDDPRA